MADSPHLTMPYLAESTGTPYVVHNSALDVIDLMTQPNVKDRDLTAPPGSPSAGDRYLIAASATGDWSGKDGQLTTYNNGDWVYSGAPQEGWEVWVQDEDLKLRYDGAAWSAAGTGGGGTLTGLTDTPGDYTDDAGKLLKVNAGETAVEFEQPPYHIGAYVPGVPTASQVMFRFVAPVAVTVPGSLANSKAASDVAADAETVFDVQKNGASIGSATFAASATTATFSGAGASFAAGDVLSVVAPGTPDAALAALHITIVATRD